MKIVTTMVPMQLVIPERYEIDLRLIGDDSMLTMVEHYGKDVTSEVLERTANITKNIAPDVDVDMNPIKRTLTLTAIGSEVHITSVLQGYITFLSKAYTV